MSFNYEVIASDLRTLRVIRQITQTELAKRSGIGHKLISAFETGRRTRSMKLSQLLDILTVLDMPAADFLNGGVEKLRRERRAMYWQSMQTWPV